MLQSKELIADINAYQGNHNEFAVWWLGQHGFIVKLEGAVIYIDPFLSDHPERKFSAILSPQEVVNADLILGTHDHDDHIDRKAWPAVAPSSLAAKFVVPESLVKTLSKDLQIPLERFIGLDDGQTAEVKGVQITGIAAAHEFLDKDPQTGCCLYLGYVIEKDGCTVYHAGDTCVYEGLRTKLERWHFDLMLLPINGRDAERFASGCVGNMTYQEAANLAGTLKPGLTVPAHFEMFEGNKEDPNLFLSYMKVKYPHRQVAVCEYGTRIVVSARRSQSNCKYK